MRLFVAVLPPRASLEELASVVERLKGLPGACELRWTGPESWHLTLAFLGEVPDDLRPELAVRLERAVRRHRTHRLRLAGGGRFGGQALWTGVRGEEEALGRLAGSVRAAVRRAGARAEDRPFRPHLTVARARGRRGGADLRPFVAGLREFEGSGWEAAEAVLVRSVLGAGPARYEAVRSWPLRPPD